MANSRNEDLGKLGDRLAEPSFRRSFAADPLGALRDAGLGAKGIDQGILDTLTELTPAELRVLAHVGKALRDAGASADAALRMV